MALPITWMNPLISPDLEADPVDLNSPNAVDVSNKVDVVLSGDFTGGENPKAEIVVFFYNSIAGDFRRTGISLTLTEEKNLEIINPTGLPLGFTAALTGDPSAFSLQVGFR